MGLPQTQNVGLSPVVGNNPLIVKTEPDSRSLPVCYLTRSQAGRTEVMAEAGILKKLKYKFCHAKISEWAVHSWAMVRLIVTPMLVGPMSSQTLQLILWRQMGHYATG